MRFLVICWPLMLSCAFIWLFLGVYWDAFWESSGCNPDDSFSPYTTAYDWWAPRGFFQITLAFGYLTFTQAKVIDIVWDIVSAETTYLPALGLRLIVIIAT